jgi:hypothetical protein
MIVYICMSNNGIQQLMCVLVLLFHFIDWMCTEKIEGWIRVGYDYVASSVEYTAHIYEDY